MKVQELKEKSVQELQDIIVDYKKQLFELRFKKSLHKLENTSQILKTKKNIARAKTIINQMNLSLQNNQKVVENA